MSEVQTFIGRLEGPSEADLLFAVLFSSFLLCGRGTWSSETLLLSPFRGVSHLVDELGVVDMKCRTGAVKFSTSPGVISL